VSIREQNVPYTGISDNIAYTGISENRISHMLVIQRIEYPIYWYFR
jgi:hypothetical protein